MEAQEYISQVPLIVRKYWLPLALSLCGLAFLVYGLISLFNFSSQVGQPDFNKQNQQNQEVSAQSAKSQIFVDVEGAVVKPGVYKLDTGSIVQDVLVLAQGLSGDADREYVAKSINLAAKLEDSAKIYIPTIGENVPEASQNSSGSVSQQGLLNINTASSENLDILPGIGPATAQKIIEGRPYSNINDLLDKRIVTSKVFSQIKDKISVY